MIGSKSSSTGPSFSDGNGWSLEGGFHRFSVFIWELPLLFVPPSLRLFAYRSPGWGFLVMFDVSWTDPTRETVGQRKNRKKQESDGLSRGSSLKSFRSSDSIPAPTRPSVLNLFNGSKKESLHRTGSQSKQSSLPSKSARRLSGYTVRPQTPTQETFEATASTTATASPPESGLFSISSDAGQSGYSEGQSRQAS